MFPKDYQGSRRRLLTFLKLLGTYLSNVHDIDEIGVLILKIQNT